MGEKPDWVRWYANKWLSGVLHLTNEQRGVYIQIINVIFDIGECPADYRYLGRLCNLRSHCVKRIVGELIEHGKLYETGAKLHQNRAETEAKLAQNYSERGRLRALKRWHGNGLADASPQWKPESDIESKTQSLSLPSESESPPTPSECPPQGGRKQGTRIKDDFWPSEEAITFCREKLGCSTALLEDEFAAFKGHFLVATGTTARKLDWDQTFVNWIRRARRDEIRREENLRRRQEGYGQRH